MIVAITANKITRFPYRCPMQAINHRGSRVCAHPDMDMAKPMPCHYINKATEYAEPASECPLYSDELESVGLSIRGKR